MVKNKNTYLKVSVTVILLILILFISLLLLKGCGDYKIIGKNESVGWDGECTDEIEDDCCTAIDECGGQIVYNPNECLHKYCYSTNDYCKPVYQEDVAGGEATYECTCADIDENFA